VKKLGESLNETRNVIVNVRSKLTAAEKQLNKVIAANKSVLEGADELMMAELALDAVPAALDAARGAEGSAMQGSMDAEQWSERQLKKAKQEPAQPAAQPHPPAEPVAATPKPPKTPSKTPSNKGSRTPRASRAKKVAKSPEPATPAPAKEADAPPRVLSPAADTAVYEQAAMQDDAQPVAMNLVPCSVCSRKFNSERIAKHEVACKKSKEAAAKRKAFDQSKARLAGTDAAQFAGKKPKNDSKYKKAEARKKNFKAKSEAFRQAMRAGRDPNNTAPAPAIENPDFVKCQHCSRSFNESAAERHIPRCKEAAMKKQGSAPKKGRVKYDPRKAAKK